MRLSSKYFILAVVLLTGIASGQVASGTPPFGSFGGGPFDTVNLGNLNVHFSIPVLHKAGRGLPFTYDLTYDSSIWTPAGNSGSQTWVPVPGWGWNSSVFSVGHIVSTSKVTDGTCTLSNGKPARTVLDAVHFTYIDSRGTSHPIVGQWGSYSNSCTGQNQTYGGSGPAQDASGYTLTALGSTVQSLVDRTGKVINAPVNSSSGTASITDANGNQLTVNSSGQFFDTLSSTTPVLTVSSAAPPTATTFTYTPPSGVNTSYTMNYQKYTVATAFGVSGVPSTAH